VSTPCSLSSCQSCFLPFRPSCFSHFLPFAFLFFIPAFLSSFRSFFVRPCLIVDPSISPSLSCYIPFVLPVSSLHFFV
jgi:hypothetical protein